MAALVAAISVRKAGRLRLEPGWQAEPRHRSGGFGPAMTGAPLGRASAGRVGAELGLVAGGRSFGGRMRSRAQAASPLPAVRGLAFLGFPLHPAGRPAQDRGKHLFDIEIPMLFLQGTRDALAMLDQLEPLCETLGRRATLKLFQDADHNFHVPARTGRKDAQIRSDMLDALAAWIDGVVGSGFR